MKQLKLILLLLSLIPAWSFAARTDSICEVPLKYEVLAKGSDTDDFLWRAEDRHYNIYYKGSDLIIERKMKGTLLLVHGQTFAPYANEEMYIDSIYFQNIEDFTQKELVINYTLFSLKPGSNTKSKHKIIIDLKDRNIILNIATYDFKIAPDENGKIIDYLYEADVAVSYNQLRVKYAEDSDIDNPVIQLSEGVYHHRNHCFLKRN